MTQFQVKSHWLTSTSRQTFRIDLEQYLVTTYGKSGCLQVTYQQVTLPIEIEERENECNTKISWRTSKTGGAMVNTCDR